MVHLFFCLAYVVSNASSVCVVQEGYHTISFSDFFHEVLMDEMFSFLNDCLPVDNHRHVEKHVSIDN